LLALTLLAAIPGVSHAAENAPVVLYGTLYIDFETVRGTGSTVAANDLPSRNRVSSNSSNFGFRGTEKLSGGNEAWFQIEMGSVSIDTGGGALAGRNSAVGMRGDWGTVFLGQWDTPYKNATSNLDPFGNTSISGYTNIMGGGTTSTSANAASRQGFDRRQRNVVQYWTPDVEGLGARLSYSANEEKNSCGAVACSPSQISGSVSYRRGELTLATAYERHSQYANTATVSTKDTGMKIGARYKFGGIHGLSAVMERLTFDGNLAATGLPKTFTVGTATKAKLDSIFVGYKGDFGAHNLRAGYALNRELKLNTGTAANTKSNYWAVGYGYDFSKRTEVVAFYTVINNASASRSDFAVNGLLGNNNNGADPKGFAIGIRHKF
jgi:predicted porin